MLRLLVPTLACRNPMMAGVAQACPDSACGAAVAPNLQRYIDADLGE